MSFKQYIFLSSILLLHISCGTNKEIEERSIVSALKPDSTIKYAKRFSIAYGDNLTVVYLFGKRPGFDTTSTFVIFKDSSAIINPTKKATLIRGSCMKIAALSSIYASVFFELGNLASLIAIDNADYINNPAILKKFEQGSLAELAKTPQINLEKTLVLKPDIIFTFGMGEGEKDRDKKLEQTKIPVAISVDHLEETPLARAEWIKFFAAFVGKREKADSIFKTVEKNYLDLKIIAQKTSSRPSVFNEIKYSDSWYMPGGKSYVAQLLKDAGANYLWQDNSDFGSLPLSFEQVYAKAKDADYWINLSTLKSKKELLAFESRYSEFNAVKKGNLYNNTKTTNSKGYSNYWETGMIFPDRILSDLILIFHPEIKAELKNDLYYYEQIK